jgi:MacB-like periplasmic core domain
MRRVTWLQDLAQDLRYGLRTLGKPPSFTAIAVLTLTLGIGANTAIFSVVNTSLLRPLPFPDSSQLVDLWGHSSLFDFQHLGLSLPDIDDIRAQTTIFSEVAPYHFCSMTLTGRGAPQQLNCAQVSAGLFPLFGIKPLCERIFTHAETRPGQDTAILCTVLAFGPRCRSRGCGPPVAGAHSNPVRSRWQA